MVLFDELGGEGFAFEFVGVEDCWWGSLVWRSWGLWMDGFLDVWGVFTDAWDVEETRRIALQRATMALRYTDRNP